MAGRTERGTIENTTVEFWNLLFAINARALFILTQEVVRIMKRDKSGGSIVNIISDTSAPYIMAYSASKGALATLTKNNGHALRVDKIRVNGVNISYHYEAAEVMRCLRAGKLESDIMPLNESLGIVKILDQIRKQGGLKYPMEREDAGIP